MKRAFTLIELLVVIAIIAILAAILFPVFAQAKAAAKKTADLSNIKQINMATQIYLADADDVLPLAFGTQVSGLWNSNSRILIPGDWSTAAPTDKRVYSAPSHPLNSTMPYMKNVDMLSMPGATKDYQPLWNVSYFEAAGKKPYKNTYTYNGLLMGFNATGIDQPAAIPVWWPGLGQAQQVGWNLSNPFLTCDVIGQPCVFSPTTGTCSNAVNGQTGGYSITLQGTVWCFNKGENWAFADGHAKFRKLGSSATGTNPKFDPFSTYDMGTGIPTAAWGDSQGCLPVLFRPDFVP